MTVDRARATELIPGAAGRVLRSVDGLADDAWAAPSLLPDWTRAHVVAHLALNAEGLARLLQGVVDDEGGPTTMYDSDDARGRDINRLATAAPGDIRDRLMAATTHLADAIRAVPEDRWGTRAERTPGGTEIRAGAVPGMRLRELEIHHVDLGTGYAPSSWQPAFAEHLVDTMTKRLDPPAAFELRPLDTELTWVVGDGDSEYPVPVVTGPVADLAWWLTGRGAADTLSCSRGELPEIEGW
jgi:maleylpyruvate isomerase